MYGSGIHQVPFRCPPQPRRDCVLSTAPARCPLTALGAGALPRPAQHRVAGGGLDRARGQDVRAPPRPWTPNSKPVSAPRGCQHVSRRDAAFGVGAGGLVPGRRVGWGACCMRVGTCEGFSCCQQRECTVGTWVGATVGRGGEGVAESTRDAGGRMAGRAHPRGRRQVLQGVAARVRDRRADREAVGLSDEERRREHAPDDVPGARDPSRRQATTGHWIRSRNRRLPVFLCVCSLRSSCARC
jgi:hypothetical protein